MSTRGDRDGTSASGVCTTSHIPGARFIGFRRGGHTSVGHDDKVIDAIAAPLVEFYAVSDPRCRSSCLIARWIAASAARPGV